MKISLIGPGIMPIPPKGWGGVESCIWAYANQLKKLGHEVSISNSRNLDMVVSEVNNWNPDFVHLHYDSYADILARFNAPLKAQTSHYPYIDYPSLRREYEWIFEKFKNNGCDVFSLSNKNTTEFIEFGISKEKVWTWVAGINCEDFRFSDNPSKEGRALCLGKIEPRKKQSAMQKIKSLDFVGPIVDNNFTEKSNYLGTWTRQEVYNNTTDYSCLVLISDGEAAPAVTLEALVSGLGLVISEEATANLDTSLPFISVLPSTASAEIVEEEINKVSQIAAKMRTEIRNYGISNFSLKNCSKKYINYIQEKLSKGNHD